VAYLRKLNEDTEAINKEVTEMVIYAQGSLTMSDVWSMSLPQRQLTAKIINNFFKAKSGKPASEDM
jgi:hypothetical protein